MRHTGFGQDVQLIRRDEPGVSADEALGPVERARGERRTIGGEHDKFARRAKRLRLRCSPGPSQPARGSDGELQDRDQRHGGGLRRDRQVGTRVRPDRERHDQEDDDRSVRDGQGAQPGALNRRPVAADDPEPHDRLDHHRAPHGDQ